jgi:hypothetical protein
MEVTHSMVVIRCDIDGEESVIVNEILVGADVRRAWRV